MNLAILSLSSGFRGLLYSRSEFISFIMLKEARALLIVVDIDLAFS
jgi:hypothetical protein